MKMGASLLKLIRAIYNCPKFGPDSKLEVDLLKERPSLLFSSHDLKMESRPEFSHFYLFSCDLTSSVVTRFFAVALISGRDLKMES